LGAPWVSAQILGSMPAAQSLGRAPNRFARPPGMMPVAPLSSRGTMHAAFHKPCRGPHHSHVSGRLALPCHIGSGARASYRIIAWVQRSKGDAPTLDREGLLSSMACIGRPALGLVQRGRSAAAQRVLMGTRLQTAILAACEPEENAQQRGEEWRTRRGLRIDRLAGASDAPSRRPWRSNFWAWRQPALVQMLK